MKSVASPKRFQRLGDFLHQKRGKSSSVREVAAMLGVSASFLYQVEEGLKKPKRDKLEQWASVYDVPAIELYKLTYQLPFPTAQMQAEAGKEITLIETLSALSEADKHQVENFIHFLIWKRQEDRTGFRSS